MLVVATASAQTFSSGTGEQPHVTEVYVMSRTKILLNGEKTNLRGLRKYLSANHIDSAKVGTLLPTPLKVFPTFNSVVELMKEHNVEAEWYQDPEFKQLFFEKGN